MFLDDRHSHSILHKQNGLSQFLVHPSHPFLASRPFAFLFSNLSLLVVWAHNGRAHLVGKISATWLRLFSRTGPQNSGINDVLLIIL